MALPGRGGEGVQAIQLPICELHDIGGGVLLDAGDPAGARDGRDVVTLREQPGTSDRGLQMLVFTAEPGSPSYDGLQLLANWAALHADAAEPAI